MSGLLTSPRAIEEFENVTDMPRRPRSESKNKYNLTPEELETMRAMSPREKKKFLKGRAS